MNSSVLKIIKNNIFGIIIGGILFGTIGVAATTYLYSSNQVSYKDSNVDEALNELYNELNLRDEIENINNTIEEKNLSFTYTNTDLFWYNSDAITPEKTVNSFALKRGKIIVINVDMVIKNTLTAWTVYTVGKMSEWSYGRRTFLAFHTLNGKPLYMAIEEDGTMTAVSRDNMTSSNLGWYKINTTMAI